MFALVTRMLHCLQLAIRLCDLLCRTLATVRFWRASFWSEWRQSLSGSTRWSPKTRSGRLLTGSVWCANRRNTKLGHGVPVSPNIQISCMGTNELHVDAVIENHVIASDYSYASKMTSSCISTRFYELLECVWKKWGTFMVMVIASLTSVSTM